MRTGDGYQTRSYPTQPRTEEVTKSYIAFREDFSRNFRHIFLIYLTSVRKNKWILEGRFQKVLQLMLMHLEFGLIFNYFKPVPISGIKT